MRRNYRIAVIDSDPLMRELAERWLSDAGHEVVSTPADSGASETGVDLIMMDVADPRDAVESVNSLRALYSAPVLLVSGRLLRSSFRSPALALQLGAAAVLPKPYSREQLLVAVAAALAAGD